MPVTGTCRVGSMPSSVVVACGPSVVGVNTTVKVALPPPAVRSNSGAAGISVNAGSPLIVTGPTWIRPPVGLVTVTIIASDEPTRVGSNATRLGSTWRLALMPVQVSGNIQCVVPVRLSGASSSSIAAGRGPVAAGVHVTPSVADVNTDVVP